MKLWRYSKWDSLLFVLSMAQFVVMLDLALKWQTMSLVGAVASMVLLFVMMTYNIIIISHTFTHTPWSAFSWVNTLISMLNSINIGQSVQAYQIMHVRNHHRYDNDEQGPDGKTKDLSSTFRDGKNGEHDSLFHYAFVGGMQSLFSNLTGVIFSIIRLWGINPSKNKDMMDLLSVSPKHKKKELLQLRLDNMAHFLGLILLLSISWHWFVFCYLPAYYLALSFVNVQNYYEHYGAEPSKKTSNSVSYYGKLYNFLSFNDGYHQEHHLRCGAHWSKLPAIYQEVYENNESDPRIISPVPSVVGFLDRKRPLLHQLKSKAEPQKSPALEAEEVGVH